MMKRLFLLLFINVVFNCFSQDRVSNVFINDSKKINSIEISKGFYLVKTNDIIKFCDFYSAIPIKKYKNDFSIIQLTQKISLLPDEEIDFYEVNNNWKLSYNISKRVKEKKSPKEPFKISVHTLNGDLFKNDWLSTAPMSKFINRYKNNFIIEIVHKDFQKLLENKFVTHINTYTTPKVETPVVESDISVNEINYVHRLYPGLNGEGITASVKELLFDTADIDFHNRFFLNGLEAGEIDSHAALIGTAIGGGGNSSIQSIGVANAVTLTSSSFLRILPDDEVSLNSSNISVQNHSYGTTIENEYGNEAAAYDTNTQNIPTLLHIFSSGNIGNLTSEEGPYAGIPNFANQTGNFKTAKNIITVGAINREREIDFRSSRGPAYDGRVKPELVAYAPGGTSDAAALISGVSVLLQQAYQNTNNILPPSSLVKASLIAGSDDIGPTGIDFESGYGNLNARQSVEVMLQNQYIEGNLSQDATATFNIDIPSNTRLLKLALTWNDPAANPGDVIALVNDIDMTLNDSDGNSWLPWVLNSFPSVDSLTQPAKRMEDHLNNVEFITLENPTSGNYTISLNGTTITNGIQPFSIAYSLIENDIFEWTYPTANDPVITEDFVSNFRWNSTLNTTTGTIEININNEGWQLLTDTADLESGLFQFLIELTIAGIAQLRMTVDNQQFVSDEFAISPELLPRVLFDCGEEILLGWNEVANATAYNVRFLDERFMEITQTVKDTTALLNKNDFPTPFFSVEPVFNNLIGVRGRTFDFELQEVNCYFINFFAFLSDDSFITTTLNLSTSINVEQVVFEKTTEGITQTVATFLPPFDDLMLTIDDLDISPGTSTYKAIISINDGTEIETQEEDIFFPFDDTLILFPNPIQSGENLNVISQGANQTYQIVEFTGRVVASGDISFINDIIEINLLPGLYIFRTIRDGRTIEAKKIVVNN